MDLEFDVIWYFNEAELRRVARQTSVRVIEIQRVNGCNPTVRAHAKTPEHAYDFLSEVLLKRDWSVLAVSPNSTRFMASYIQGILLRENNVRDDVLPPVGTGGHR